MARPLSPRAPLPFPAAHSEVRVVDDVATAFAETVVGAFQSRASERFVLVLSGGATARHCYEALARRAPADGPVDWQLVDVLMGDERCVAPDDPDANQRLVRETLLDVVGPVGSFNPMSCTEGPDAYQEVLERHRSLDVVHLGLGPDGHTASLFSDSPGLDAPPGRLVVRNQDPSGTNPHPRLSLTYAAIARAVLALFTVSGAAKRAAFACVQAGGDLPASRVAAARVLWLADLDAVGARPPAAWTRPD